MSPPINETTEQQFLTAVAMGQVSCANSTAPNGEPWEREIARAFRNQDRAAAGVPEGAEYQITVNDWVDDTSAIWLRVCKGSTGWMEFRKWLWSLTRGARTLAVRDGEAAQTPAHPPAPPAPR